MTEKERRKLHQNGIFTVTQLSHTFRLRRNRKDPGAAYRARHNALTALAIREQRIHILGDPGFELRENPVYLDVEGSSNSSGYYLIGICYSERDRLVYRALWADCDSEEKHICQEFLKTLKGFREWETKRDVAIKQQLLTYNEDDCRALVQVAEAIASLSSVDAREDVVPVTETPFVGGFGRETCPL